RVGDGRCERERGGQASREERSAGGRHASLQGWELEPAQEPVPSFYVAGRVVIPASISPPVHIALGRRSPRTCESPRLRTREAGMGKRAFTSGGTSIQTWPETMRRGESLHVAFLAPALAGRAPGREFEVTVHDQRRRAV